MILMRKLDNCFTNRPDPFGKTYLIKMLIKTDQKVQFRDCREHRKRALYLADLALASECWDKVLEADNIETAVNILELKILSNILKQVHATTNGYPVVA